MIKILIWTLLAIPLSTLILLGTFTGYAAYRFVRKEGRNVIDQTAGALSFLFVIWAVAMNAVLVAEKLPFVTKDLREWLNLRPDDNELT